MTETKKRILPVRDVCPADFKEFFKLDKTTFLQQYDEAAKTFPGGKFDHGWWKQFCFKKNISGREPNNEEELLKVYSETASANCLSFYDGIFSSCGENFLIWLETNPMWMALKYFPNLLNLNILDFGCGSGVYGISMYMNGANLVLSDIHSIFSEYLNWLFTKLKLEQIKWIDSSEKTDFGENIFDYILATECMEHLFEPEIYLRKLFQALKPNGLFYCSATFGSWDTDLQHLPKNDKRYGQGQWVGILKSIGFRDTEQIVHNIGRTELINAACIHKHLWIK